ncbi:hypothetical protein [Canibacter oris]|uniref:Uncharacterized protein n=1 Tax=Canibacter oris TaxID=1365628 RepID=A0A840DRE7_9MICO|nr:hypothetical protein [Canibacter oris]MBB4071736.1 hypothetical protein [Canibacter oris]
MNSFPSAADRDAAKRAALQRDETLVAADFTFKTRNLSTAEKAAAVAALAALRTAENKLLKKRERIERDPWRRSQRAQRRIEEFFDGT